MKIKLKHRKQVLWLESDDNNFIVHRGVSKFVDKNGKEFNTKIDPSH